MAMRLAVSLRRLTKALLLDCWRIKIHSLRLGISAICTAVSVVHFQKFRKSVISRALTKSIKNAPTIGTTRNARGAGP